MSAYFTRQIDSVKDNIYFLERELDEFYYEAYICHRERCLLQYELTVREIDDQYDELEKLEKRYKIELSKERYKHAAEACKRADEASKRAQEELHRILATLTSQVERLLDLENEKNIRGEMEVEHIGDANTKNQLNEDDVLIPDSLHCEKHVNEDTYDKESHVEKVSLVQEQPMVDDIIDVEHIDFIILEYLPTIPLLAHQFHEFFASHPFFVFKWNEF